MVLKKKMKILFLSDVNFQMVSWSYKAINDFIDTLFK